MTTTDRKNAHTPGDKLRVYIIGRVLGSRAFRSTYPASHHPPGDQHVPKDRQPCLHIPSHSHFFPFSVLLIALFLLIPVTASAAPLRTPVDQGEIKAALVEFHNRFLPNVDYYADITYPRDMQYQSAMDSLIIAFGLDIAIILTYGKSEVVVQVVDVGIQGTGIVNVVSKTVTSGKPVHVLVEYTVESVIVGGIEGYVDSKIPGLRTIKAGYGVFKAGQDHQDRIIETINQQRELLLLATDTASAAADILQKINMVEDPVKQTEYRHVLSAMLKRKAEISVYRQAHLDLNELVIADLEFAVLQTINPSRANEMMRGSRTWDKTLRDSANSYVGGHISREVLLADIQGYMRMNYIAPNLFTDDMARQYLRKINNSVKKLDKARTAVNKHGGSPGDHPKSVSHYSGLVSMIPKDYRMIAGFDPREAAQSFTPPQQGSAPDQGTGIPWEAPGLDLAQDFGMDDCRITFAPGVEGRLFEAIEQGNARTVEASLKSGASPDAMMYGDCEYCESAMTIAAYLGHVEAARLLLNAGADVNMPACREQTPLHNAAQGGSADMVRLLLQHGANPNARNDFMETPLDIARTFGNQSVVDLLGSVNSLNPAGLYQRTGDSDDLVDGNLFIEPAGNNLWAVDLQVEYEGRGCAARGEVSLRNNMLIIEDKDCQREGRCGGPCIVLIAFDGPTGPLGTGARVDIDFAMGCPTWFCGATGGPGLDGLFEKRM